MAVREHGSQHDTVADSRSFTESTTVAGVATTDRDRRSELRSTVQRWLEARERADRCLAGAVRSIGVPEQRIGAVGSG